jgi:hypothetical protein
MGAAVRALPLLLVLAIAAALKAEALSLDVHHRYSATVRGWAEAAGHPGHRAAPAAGTAEYYAALAGHDLRRRSLAAAAAAAPAPGAGGGPLAFADGNETYRISDFGL